MSLENTAHRDVPVRPVTRGPLHHWFGYYDKCPWDAAGKRLLVAQSPFADRQPRPEDTIRLGWTDPAGSGRFEPFAKTQAWCWQMGCMLQWLPPDFERRVIYNVRDTDTFRSVVHDVSTGERRTLPRPVFAIAPDGRTALSINFSRLATRRPGYGYAGIPDPFSAQPAPEDDGVWRMDLDTGDARLILSVAQLARISPAPDMVGADQRIEHVQISPDGSRFALLHRYARPGGRGFLTRLFTVGMDGSDPCCLNPNRMSSHYDWRDPDHILAWARTPDSSIESPVEGYILFTDRSSEFTLIGANTLLTDGHCSFSPDRRMILTDTYADREGPDQILILYDPERERRMDIGRFPAPPLYRGEIRCDLHPRWSRNGRDVCFDSAHDGTRQVYIANASAAL